MEQIVGNGRRNVTNGLYDMELDWAFESPGSRVARARLTFRDCSTDGPMVLPLGED